MTEYKDENGNEITATQFYKGKAKRARVQATAARKELSESELDEEEFKSAEEKVLQLERHADRFEARLKSLEDEAKAAASPAKESNGTQPAPESGAIQKSEGDQ